LRVFAVSSAADKPHYGKEPGVPMKGKKAMDNSAPRLFVALVGDITSEPPAQVKYGFFIRALEKSFRVVVCDATLRGFPRLINAAQVFSPNRALWKARFYQNVPAFRLRSQKVAKMLGQYAGKLDAILQIGVLFDASWEAHTRLPSVIYTDYTQELSSRKPEAGRSPFTKKERDQWFQYEKRAFQQAAHICTRGKFVRQSILDDYQIPVERVTAIGGGVNFETLPNIQPKKHDSNPTVLFIGKDFYRKGGDLLLQAFCRVRQVIPNAQLVMVTEGLPSQGFDLTGVRVVPPTWDRRTICGLYEQVDCFVLPSRLETWGDVLLEAMAYGLPCVGVAGEAMGEMIQDGKTGLIVPPGDIAALSEALIQLLANRSQCARFGAAARERVESTFTWEQVVKSVSQVYSTISKALPIQ
jgi:glycosyltransferase involved in cell wall biosynthesis